MKYFVLLFFVCSTFLKLKAQDYTPAFETGIKQEQSDWKGFNFSLNTLAFFKNNEYFNDVYEGYTLPGYYIIPSIRYHHQKKFFMEWGGYFLKYSGLNKYSEIKPFYRLYYQTSNSSAFILGNINASMHHQLLEPLYGMERFLQNNYEEGVQWYLSTDKLFVDTWINWEYFIFFNDPKKELLSGGISVKYNITDTLKSFNAGVFFQYLSRHRGGQITVDTGSLSTISNPAAGVEFKYRLGGKHQSELGSRIALLAYMDISPSQDSIADGYGSLFSLFYRNTSWFSSVSYWDANNYYAPMGDGMYMSYMPHLNFYREKKQMWQARVMYHKKVTDAVRFAAGWDVYYDINIAQLDHAFGLYLQFYNIW